MGHLKPAVTNTECCEATVKTLGPWIHLYPDLHKKATVMDGRSAAGKDAKYEEGVPKLHTTMSVPV